MALLELGGEVSQADLDLVLFPTVLNFLYQSRGMIAVLPVLGLALELPGTIDPLRHSAPLR